MQKMSDSNSGWCRRFIGLPVLLTAMLLSLSGCGTWLFPQDLHLDPGVIADMRNVGKVVAETTIKKLGDGTNQICKILIVDAGASNNQSSVDRARELLRTRGWKVRNQRFPQIVTSDKWKGVVLSVDSLESFSYERLAYPQINGVLREAKAKAESETLVVLELDPTDTV